LLPVVPGCGIHSTWLAGTRVSMSSVLMGLMFCGKAMVFLPLDAAARVSVSVIRMNPDAGAPGLGGE